MPGPAPRQHEHERRYTAFTPFILTRRIRKDDYDGQMIFGDFVALELPDICVTGEEKPRNDFTQDTCSDRGSNPDPLRGRRICYRLLLSDGLINLIFNYNNHVNDYIIIHIYHH